MGKICGVTTLFENPSYSVDLLGTKVGDGKLVDQNMPTPCSLREGRTFVSRRIIICVLKIRDHLVNVRIQITVH